MSSRYYRAKIERHATPPSGDAFSPALILRVGMLCCAVAIVIALAVAALN